MTSTEILEKLTAAGITAKVWTGGNVTRVYIRSTPEWVANMDYGYITPGKEWRGALANCSNKIRAEMQRILFP